MSTFASFLASSKGSSKNLYSQAEWKVMIGLQAHGASVSLIAKTLDGRTKLSVQTTLYNFKIKCQEEGVEKMVRAKCGCTVEECMQFAKEFVEAKLAE